MLCQFQDSLLNNILHVNIWKKTIFAFNWFDVRTTNQTCEGWCFCDSSRTTGRIAAALWDGCAAAACCFCECVCCKLLRLSVARQMVQGLLLMEGVYNLLISVWCWLCICRSCVSAARLTSGLRLPDGRWGLCFFRIMFCHWIYMLMIYLKSHPR